ncbi:High affinity methionine permease [Komagataella phaffii CBS 7435]|uniref:High affinity methionine permease n=2 Tax=Komagataella phaffii TaxID=460519 RepID=F2QXN5_KOMPC|nr:High affinity methionine permease, integral membrane protein with 13 putative membrane-spanning regi [Komagataella phaffii GS115]AOA63826.1 GQ67_03030T0 [Komagataella phaffii]CAH2450333.1 High affinity methionine permease [Komagataella phaffii CBS 7435]AOA68400.1 GQ68_03015T0 [Komagataella phaffii GS115]CAY69948.1 High affinity methionine permease, integral membrane protein with 13 putative membrane-spanning regi [Komagataella phaffii GS115]CCA40163.1 High affinity methionine permease [Koma
MAFLTLPKNVFTSTKSEHSTEEFQENVEKSSSLEKETVGEQTIELDTGDRRIGLVTAAFLITNRILGAGIFATPSTILLMSGSVGTALMLWVLGMLIALSGLFVYAEFGSYPSRLLQRNGGEKNYLEYAYSRPKYLVTCMYALYILLTGGSAGICVVFGEYILRAAQVEPTEWAARGLGIASVCFAFLVNTLNVKVGIFVLNVLGTFKIVIVLLIAVTGWVALGGGIKNEEFTPTHAFSNAFQGTSPTAYGVVISLYNVIWSFMGYSNVNYNLSEVKNPIKALKYSAPIAVVSLGIIYILVNIAYFAVVPFDVMTNSGRILAADFFRIAFGTRAERACSVFIALSALGNVIAATFSQGRIVQQFGREGILPYSAFWASQKPFNSPFTGLLEHCIIIIITIVAPPAGDAYDFVLNLISYPMNIINFFVAGALLWLRYEARKGRREWIPNIKTPVPVIVFFLLSSLYLIIAPYIPPAKGQSSVYNHMPYWIHCVAAWGIFALGVLYWIIWGRVIPKVGKYRLISRDVHDTDGYWRNKFFKIPYSYQQSDEEFIAQELQKQADKETFSEKPI